MEARAAANGWTRRQLRLALWRWRWRWPGTPALAVAATLAPRFGAWGASLYASRVSSMWTAWLRHAARARASGALEAGQRAVSEAAAREEEATSVPVPAGAVQAEARRAAMPVVEADDEEADAARADAEAARRPIGPQRFGRFTVVAIAIEG